MDDESKGNQKVIDQGNVADIPFPQVTRPEPSDTSTSNFQTHLTHRTVVLRHGYQRPE